jgi:hypothetical protein
VEVIDGEVDGLAHGLRGSCGSRHRSADEDKIAAILCDGETVVGLGHLKLSEGIEEEALVMGLGLNQGGRQRWQLLQGLKGGDGGTDVSTELGYEPQELYNHGGIHGLVGWLVL